MLIVVATIAVWIPATGSEFGKLVLDTARGYGWFEKKLSLEHLNTNPPVSIPTVSLVDRPWLGIVRTSLPENDVYTALVAVNELAPVAAKLPLRIEPIPALTKRCSYDWSVIPIATDPPRYPEPNVRSSKNSNASPPPTYVCTIVLGPACTSNDLSETIPTKNNGLSWSWNIVVVTPL